MRLAILDPGHFHAALLQKKMYANVDPVVHVYAPAGPDLDDYVQKVESFNRRAQDPTRWELRVTTGDDYMDRFAADGKADIAVISGNNRRKAEMITRAVAAGVHVLADKPMAIDTGDFAALRRAFDAAAAKGRLLYDIMTERHEITTMLQKALSRLPAVFGELQRGSEQDPAITKESVHHFSKLVAGAPIKRPAWFFDVEQQGEGLVDITTHLVDLVQWECFPGESLDFRHDVEVLRARRWPTELSLAQFTQVTRLPSYPDFLRKDVQRNGELHTFANGEIHYRLKGVHANVSVLWNFEAPAGAGDTHFSLMRGTRSNLVIRQGEEQGYQPVLTVEPHHGTDREAFERDLQRALAGVQRDHPGVGVKAVPAGWEVTVPAAYHVGHEAHFGQVAEQFLSYVERGRLPEWEVPCMLAKYFTTTTALAMAKSE